MSEQRVKNAMNGSVGRDALQAGHIGEVHIYGQQMDTGDKNGTLPDRLRTPLFEQVQDFLAGGAKRRLARAGDRLALVFSTTPTEKAAREYRRALRLALRVDSAQASVFFQAYDSRIPVERYPFTEADEPWLTGLTLRADHHVLTVVFELTTRLHLVKPQIRARDRLTDVLADQSDANTVIFHLHRWQELKLLEPAAVKRILEAYVRRASLESDRSLWQKFLLHLPQAFLPDLFEVHCLLDRGRLAVELADTPARIAQAMACCLRCTEVDDVAAGLELARHQRDTDHVVALSGRLADLLFEAERYAEALPAYREAGRQDRVSHCHEGLRQFFEALATCPPGQAERLVTLADLCLPDIQVLVDRQQFVEAARQIQSVIVSLDRTAERTPELVERRDHAASVREGLLGATRRHFGAQARRAASDSTELRLVHQTWSRFEEAAGELVLAAFRAEDADEFFRANRLFHQAGQFGEAARVLHSDDTPQGLAARAEAYEAGGDLTGAARLYERCDQRDHAVDLYLRSGDFADAVYCLLQWRGTEAVEDVRFEESLRRCGDHDELVRQCLSAISARGASSRGVAILRRLADERMVPPQLSPEVSEALNALGARERQLFQERAQAWVARARAEIDQRFSRAWGFDLGTTTCAVAIYDSRTGQPVFCPWKGEPQFASTVSLDETGNELIGLSGESILAQWLVGHIDLAKRRMGRRTLFKIRDRSYRPEEVAARLIRHARGMVESFLATKVRERVGELASAELGQVRDEWLSWAEHNHDLRLDRPQSIVTIPAYFTNNQKDATRSAAKIADVHLVRLIHEPTAACLAAARERRFTGTVVVVDLGAGTLDISAVCVEDGVHEVLKVGGDTGFGGKDLDTAIAQVLVSRLRQRGVEVPSSGRSRKRLEVAAEALKIALSTREHASYPLLAFGSAGDVELELTRGELAEILTEPLARLRRLCADFRESLDMPVDRLVLVGRPMLSPLLSDAVRHAFEVPRVEPTDPRTAVASGAALQAAVLEGLLTDVLLLDVTPLALGIRTVDDQERHSFTELIPANCTIPTRRSQTFTTAEDNQSGVNVEIFNGSLHTDAKIGQFKLTGIPPAAKGTPKIEVTFDLDNSCVLNVTAHDLGTGQATSISVTDTTLLPPAEVADLTHRFEQQRDHEDRRRHLDTLREQLRELAEAAMSEDSVAAWREFRQRQSAHSPSTDAQDPNTQQQLVEMFNEATQTELDLELCRRSAQKCAQAALTHLAQPTLDLAEDLDVTARIADQLRDRLAELSRLITQVTRWSAVLTRLAMTEPNPLLRFRTHVDSGNYRQALEAIAQLAEPLSDPSDIDRQARCLAEVGDVDGYRALRGATAPEATLAALVDIQVALTGGGITTCTGFLIEERVVVTSRAQMIEPGTDRPVPDHAVVVAGARSVDDISTRGGLAVLHLTEPIPVPVPRLGHTSLVRIGDQVHVPVRGETAEADWTVHSGVVDRFEPAPGGAGRQLRVGIRLEPSSLGAPVLDELGEVVGVITACDPDHFAITGIDALRTPPVVP
ncbi:Hsp70 family protein [Lentzea sp. NPDC005914]|uniref:Hsp70 family protein n=1 Tax=Lentzea sp. NPDC005914 TaxID=3154572 RepID=UPI0034095BD0